MDYSSHCKRPWGRSRIWIRGKRHGNSSRTAGDEGTLRRPGGAAGLHPSAAFRFYSIVHEETLELRDFSENNFIEVELTYKIYPFKVYSSMTFSKFALPPSSFRISSSLHQDHPCPFTRNPCFRSQPQATTILLSVSVRLFLQAISYKQDHTVFYFLLLSLSVVFLKSIHVVMCISILFFFIAEQWSIVQINYILFIHQLMDIWVVSTLGLLWMILLWAFLYRSLYSFE